MSVGLQAALGGFAPRVLVTLGSGLGALADEVADPIVVPYDQVGLPISTVPGHQGRFVAGTLAGVPVLVQQGRVHLYEGASAEEVGAFVRAAAAVGVTGFVVTNAAGGIRLSFSPGDLMVITDQLNLTATAPLVGPHFVDMTGAYDPALVRAAHAAAEAAGERLVEGVYAGLRGPAYETPAEVTMLRTLGADATGMSTVNEVIQARALGLRVAGFSLITNVHRPGGTPTHHGEVMDVGAAAGPRLAAVVRALLPELAASPAGA
jgi:purine-nucleoside phosphorylase